MKKVLLLIVALISLAVMGCSDSNSDEEYVSGIASYETYLGVKNAWKEPTSYSYTAHIGAWKPEAFVIDVKVTKGVSTFSLNPDYKYYSSSDTPEGVCKEIESRGWDIKTMTGLFESIEKKNVNITTDPFYRRYYKCCFIEIKYDKCNDISFPCCVTFYHPLRDPNLIGGNYDSATITDFKILEE